MLIPKQRLAQNYNIDLFNDIDELLADLYYGDLDDDLKAEFLEDLKKLNMKIEEIVDEFEE